MSPNPTLTEKLQEGATLGFRKGEVGQILAVFGEREHALPKGTPRRTGRSTARRRQPAR